MPQLGLYVGGGGIEVGLGLGVGAIGMLLAWDRFDRGPSAADEYFTPKGCALYSLMAPVSGALVAKMKTKSPIKIPEANCPEYPNGWSSDFLIPGSVRDYVNRIEVKPGGSAFTSISDFSFDIFEGSTRIYSAAPENNFLKMELAEWSLLPNAVSVQARLTTQYWDDPLGFDEDGWLFRLNNTSVLGKEIWRELMTPNAPLAWFPPFK